MFPQESITIIEHNETGSDILNKSILPSGDYYIQNISILSKDNRSNTVYCGGSPVLVERPGTTFINEAFNYHCLNTVKADLYRTSSIHITYMEATGVSTSTGTTTSMTTAMLGSLNMGLAIIITLLFIVIIGFIFNNLDLKAKPWLR